MDRDRAVTASFTRWFQLSTSVSPDGAGTVLCDGWPCQASYPEGVVVDVTATASEGFAFDSWSGDCAGSGACVVAMDRDRSVAATFSAVVTP
jgi:hypothetical protein